MQDRKARITSALWGLFIADALAMPAHWYYNRQTIREQFNGGIQSYLAPPHPHPEAFMVGMGYYPDLEQAERLGRPYDILHQHSRFYNTSWSTAQVAQTEREPEHGNAVAGENQRYHYHHGLNAGENTLNAHLARVLMRSVIARGGYDSGAFLDEFIQYMTTPGLNRDPYTEVFLRRWFENWCSGTPAHASAQMQRDNWSIGSHGGMIRPLVLSMLSSTPFQAIGMALEHQNLTHRSETVASALTVTVPLLFDLLAGRAIDESITAAAANINLPRIRGEQLLANYRAASGPNNIADADMWRFHMDYTAEPMDLAKLLRAGEDAVIRTQLGTICYVEHGLPMMLFLAAHENFDPRNTLLLNVNAGGDNVNGAMPLGLLMGASSSTDLLELREGLADFKALSEEIAAYADIAISGTGNLQGFEAPARRTSAIE